VTRTRALLLLAAVAILPFGRPAPAGATLAEARERGALTACVDPYNYPYSAQGSEPPGFDVEVARAIAQRAGLRSLLHWADTGTRGGLGRALRLSIQRGQCEFFMGIPATPGMADEMAERKLKLTRPYLGLAYVLVVRGPAAGAKSLADLKGTKIGVPMSTPADAFLHDRGYDRELFLRNREIMAALAKGELAAGLVWGPALAAARREFPDAKFEPIPGYVPDPSLRWDLAAAAPAADRELHALVDQTAAQLVESGEMKRIVERYGLPYLAPAP
jgi:polar amino acid transport system substrate-binding protein